jgi:hypothetical protein
LGKPQFGQESRQLDYIGKKEETVAAPFCVALTLELK